MVDKNLNINGLVVRNISNFMFFVRYKEKFAELRTLKSEIEHLQHFLERSKVKLMKDFELWWADQMITAESQAALTAHHKPAQDIKYVTVKCPPSHE